MLESKLFPFEGLSILIVTPINIIYIFSLFYVLPTKPKSAHTKTITKTPRRNARCRRCTHFFRLLREYPRSSKEFLGRFGAWDMNITNSFPIKSTGLTELDRCSCSQDSESQLRGQEEERRLGLHRMLSLPEIPACPRWFTSAAGTRFTRGARCQKKQE